MTDIYITEWYLQDSDPEWHLKVMEALGLTEMLFHYEGHVEGAKLPCKFSNNTPDVWFSSISISLHDILDSRNASAWRLFLGVKSYNPGDVYSEIQRRLNNALGKLSIANPRAEILWYELDPWQLYVDMFQNGKKRQASIDLLAWFDRKEMHHMDLDEEDVEIQDD